MYYIIGDIHGYFGRLVNLFNKLTRLVQDGDTIIFLGDYIDRGPHSYEVIDFLIQISRTAGLNSVFLKGNHEDMLLTYLRGEDSSGAFMINGGDATMRSYITHLGAFELPDHHRDFFNRLALYYEGGDFIAVHAGLNPEVDSMEEHEESDLLWIREKFFRANKRWDKTIIFGHTPVPYIEHGIEVYEDRERNIIGIDSGVFFGNQLTCIVWPERRIIKG